MIEYPDVKMTVLPGKTWLNENDCVIRHDICPDGYVIKDQPRGNRRGGGTGVLCLKALRPEKISVGQTRSFEYSKYAVRFDGKKFFIHVIYRPPYSERNPVSTNVFFEEFTDYLEGSVVCVEPIIISGDFNIHVDISKDPDAERFLALLESIGLENHVFIQTHESGHALDLLITRKDCDFSLGSPITDFYISDLSFVKCTINVSKPELEVKDIVFRKLKSINADAFKNDIEVSELCSRDFTDLDELVTCYNATLTELIDKHAPEPRKRITVRPKQPWFSNNLAKLKRERRKLERKWIKSKTELDHEYYRQC
eukprot:gene16057-7404_t